MAEFMTTQDFVDGRLDTQTLEEAVNEDKMITSRLGREYASVPMASRLLVENGLLGATPFLNYASMSASALANGAYAIVTYDTDISKNGFYQKSSGIYYYLRWNPSAQMLATTNRAALYFSGDITVDTISGKATYPPGIAIKDGSNFLSFAGAVLDIGFNANKKRAYSHYLDYGDMTIKSSSGSNASTPLGASYTQISNSYQDVFNSPYKWVKKSVDALSALSKAIINPLHSVQIKLIGDSITWGEGAIGNSTKEPRNHSLSDARNNLIAPTWANLLRDWLGKTYLDESVLNTESPLTTGSGFYQKIFYVDPTADKNIQLVKDGLGIDKTITTRTEPYFARCLDISTNNNLNSNIEFELFGDNFIVRHAGQSSGTNRFVDIYDNNVKIGEIDYSSPVAWGLEKSFTLPFGRHFISIRNRSTDGGLFRLEAIKVTQKIRVINDGLQGTWSGEWLPSGSLLSTVSTADEFIFLMLGTNDRGVASKPTDPQRTKDNLRTIANHLLTIGKQVVLMSANAVDSSSESGKFYNQGDVARVTKSLAIELNLSYIDNYQATVQDKIDGTAYLSDGLHPNNLGHRIIFNNIRAAINNI